MTRQEPDFPPGHPARFDFDPDSPDAQEWRRIHVHPLGERDFPVGHPKALDTPGNHNKLEVLPGVDPHNPHLEAFTGRTPEVAERLRQLNSELSVKVPDSPAPKPLIAPEPPPPGSIAAPTGQPGGN